MVSAVQVLVLTLANPSTHSIHTLFFCVLQVVDATQEVISLLVFKTP